MVKIKCKKNKISEVILPQNFFLCYCVSQFQFSKKSKYEQPSNS